MRGESKKKHDIEQQIHDIQETRKDKNQARARREWRKVICGIEFENGGKSAKKVLFEHVFSTSTISGARVPSKSSTVFVEYSLVSELKERRMDDRSDLFRYSPSASPCARGRPRMMFVSGNI